MFSCFAEQIEAASHFNQFRHPIPGRHERLNPLNAGHGRPGLDPLGFISNARHPALELLSQFAASFGDTERVRNTLNIRPYVGQRVWFERNDYWF